MSLNFIKNIFALLGAVLISFAAVGQLQTNKPNASTIPAVSNVFTPNSNTGTYPLNYVRTWNALGRFGSENELTNAGYKNVVQTTDYFGGLGRPLQTVTRQATPGASPKDVVTPFYYDNFGQESYKFMPYVPNVTDGLFRTNPFVEQKAYLETQYAAPAENVFYSKTDFEISPLNRVEKTMSPGNSWAGSGKGIQQKYLINIPADEVVNWTITSNTLTYANNDENTNIPTAAAGIYYGAGQLYKNVTVDENNNATVVYKDKEEKVILKKVQIGTIASDYSGYNGFLCTYYIYDDLGNLRFALPPKAVEAINPNWTLSGATMVINELCFRYEYDHRNRTIAKKAPGAGWAYMIYDGLDRLVFTQDANLRTKNQWMTTLYDALDRQVMTGITTYAGTPTALQSIVTNQTTPPIIPPGTQDDITLSAPTYGDYTATSSITLSPGFESSVGGASFSASILSESIVSTPLDGVTISSYPIPGGAPFIPLTITYYDHYDWTNKAYTPSYINSLNEIYRDESKGVNLHPEALPTQASQQTYGLVTGTKTRILTEPNNLSLGSWLTTVNFYDNKNRMIQVQADNHKQGQDIVASRYDFTGKLLATYQVHNNPDAGTATTRIKTIYTYDPGGRLLETWKIINDEDIKKTLIARNEYDELGQLKKKELGKQKDPATGDYTTTPIETLNYTYNVRGWLQGINKDYVAEQPSGNGRWFGMELNYDWGFQTNQLNGNIAGVKWRSKGDAEKRSYGFSYDPVNRLLGADFGQHNGSAYVENGIINFDMQVGDGHTISTAYDENGNIQALKQWGLKVNNSLPIDDMVYSYHPYSNKLQRVRETNTGTTDHKLGDFADKSTGNDDYGYDLNGNMITDLNKKMIGATGLTTTSAGAIVYNHLNLPWKITVKDDAGSVDKGFITYTYDAAGTKLQKIVEDKSVSGKTVTTISDYLGGMTYESKTTVGGNPPPGPQDSYQAKLQFIGQAEGRIRYKPAEGTTPAAFVYDYFVKDHLGNTRMVLTEEQKQDAYPAATLEGVRTAGALSMINYEKQFYTISDTYLTQSMDVPGWSLQKDYANNNGNPPPNNSYPPNYTPNSTAISQYLYRLNATTNKTGLGMVLKVMVGDKIDIHGKSYYQSTQTYNNSNSTPLILTDIIGAFIGAPDKAGFGLKGITAGAMETINAGIIPATFIRGNNGESTTVPKAYINYLFFDEQFKYISGGASRAGTSGSVKNHWFEDPQLQNINVPKNGYVYIYVSNESNANVFFDNLQVFHTRGPVLEETHYYPFGLTMAGISAKAIGSLENKLKFNGGTELNSDLDINLYETNFRSLDPQLGRFWQVDPLDVLSVDISPYAFASNNPISRNDPAGAKDTVVNGETVQRDSDLPTVTVSADSKKKKKKEIAWGGFYWPRIEKDQLEWNDKMYQRIHKKEELSQPGDPAWLKSQTAFHKRNYQAKQDHRKMSIGVVVIIGGPLLGSSLAGTGYGTILYNALAPKLQFSAAGGVADYVNQRFAQGKSNAQVNWATVFTNTVLGGRNIVSSSLWESTGSFFTINVGGEKPITLGTNFNANGLIDFGAGAVGNLYGNVFGAGVAKTTPGIIEENGKFTGWAFDKFFTFAGEFSGNLISNKITE